MNFWKTLPTGFSVLAPMDDVTDVAFRQVVARAAAPDVLFTEFVATDGMQSPGRQRTLERLRLEPEPHPPVVAQIWGDKPENYRLTARDIVEMGGFAGIDINFGCPERGIVARGCCGGMIGRNELAAEIIAATKDGAGKLPVSVKTRVGLATTITEAWAGFLLKQDLAALTIHARTVREMSKVPARWEELTKVVALRNSLAPDTVIIGNGDVMNRRDADARIVETGVDGVMIGRGIFHDLFAFAKDPVTSSPEQMLGILLSHLDLYEQYGRTKPFHVLKKFIKVYVSSWPGASELRAQLMDANSPDEVRSIVSHTSVPSLVV